VTSDRSFGQYTVRIDGSPVMTGNPPPVVASMSGIFDVPSDTSYVFAPATYSSFVVNEVFTLTLTAITCN
jgi:hypothetical protein